jgi:RepB DNA-primase N-terminal domain
MNNTPSTTLVMPNTGQTIDFLEALYPNNIWHLVAIFPEGRVEARSFSRRERKEALVWLNALQGKANCYFHVNSLKSGVKNCKASKKDVKQARFLHVDVDDPQPEALEKLRNFDPRPSVILFSGGGYQAFWLLDEATKDLDRVERINRALAEKLGGDNCHNVDRIMRLPGTINMPNEKKAKKGRVPTLAYIIED